jgi:D-inositol-3-phosphate glycosyltransferase
VTTLTADTAAHSDQSAQSAMLEVALLTGGFDRPYAYGLAMALVAKGVLLDVIGSDNVDSPEMHATPGLHFFNLWPPQSSRSTALGKLLRVLRHYARLIRYSACAKPKIFHILWNSKIQIFDRTLLMLYYRAMGKKIALTAHNVNEAKRDGKDSWLNRATLKIQYRLCDHIFVHTQKMKEELCRRFAVAEKTVIVIPFPINNASPDTELTSVEAKRRLGLRVDERAILFFGRIRPYKGIEYLLDAFRLLLANKQANYRLIVAGEAIKGCEGYLQEIQSSAAKDFDQGQVVWKTEFIPDDEVEVYLKAADVLVLPYKEIFQSGVMFLAYAFGLPVIATDVGSFREEIVEGSTGYLCKAEGAAGMASAIETYFASDLFTNLDIRRQEIKDYANAHHSWHTVAELSSSTYAKMLATIPI